MNDEINYKSNPLHGVSLKNLLIEMVDYYGFDILFAYLNINCFKTNPSIESSVKFLKKTDWAREKVEAFYLYKFKNLPKVSADQYEIPPRSRVLPEGQLPGEPAELSLEDAERVREIRAKHAAARGQGDGHRSGAGKRYGGKPSAGYYKKPNNDSSRNDDRESSNTSTDSSKRGADLWGKWKK